MKFTLVIVLFLAFSCSLNKVYLRPEKLLGTERITYHQESTGDTLQLYFSGQQPHIINLTDTNWQAGFSIQSLQLDHLNAWEIRSDTPNGSLIYFLHGNAGNMLYQYGLMLPFVKRGYDVFMIDYSGFGFSQGKATRKQVFKDAVTGFEYLLKGALNGRKLIVYGQSLGGHLALSSARPYAKSVDILVAEGAFASHRQIASDQAGFLGKLFVREMYCGSDSIHDNGIPTLIIHSTEDKTIPYYHSEILYQAASEPKRLLTIDKGHIRGPLFYADSITEEIEKIRRK